MVKSNISASVIPLPTAHAEPIVNPRWRGRYPANVIRVPRTTVVPGDLVVVTVGSNRGIQGVIERFVSIPAGEERRGRWCLVRATVKPFPGSVDVATNEPRGSSELVMFPAVELRRAIANADHQQRYALPAWPKRWEKALARTQGGGGGIMSMSTERAGFFDLAVMAWQLQSLFDALHGLLPEDRRDAPVALQSLASIGSERANHLASLLSDLGEQERRAESDSALQGGNP